ncbi:guanine nucleotide-binding protein-like 3 [Salmo salar]|uniref:Guanine nucleotide-binding protein-like 3 n=1 Tax=Salmo salar TaxID=8030 RepID=A0A1S3P3L4_SALSA|nr:guanine nucleotide-binding protein-like 3 [Salmo salar]|eukprot:XP_014022218.1 PREDICTED: guanine nucleotide-binding protein-like 3 [Salmo salar]
MKRPGLKKASKRVSCSKRYKIQKKVREHNKKLRKDAKKKGVGKKVKKDIGVPNKAPFKEDILREAEQRRSKLEEEKEKKKLAKQQERAQKRKKENAAGRDADPKAKKARKELPSQEDLVKQMVKQSDPRNSKKHLCSELNKVIDASDVIVEILDARDPLGCRCPQLEEAVLKREGNKKLLFLLNKIDLVPKENVEKWLQCLQLEFPVVAFKASTQLQDKTVQEKKARFATLNGVVDQTKGVACYGSSSLLQLLGDYANATGREGSLKVGLVGFPNVGKSSLINSLKGLRACNAGVQRGITRCFQDVHISKNVKMIDSPGIVAAQSNPKAAMALRSLQVEDKQETVLEAVRTLLKQCNKQQVMLQYNVPDFRNSLEFLSFFAKKRGFLQKGGVPNTELAASTFLNDWTGAKLSYHCKAPEKPCLPPYLSEDIVREMQNGWDLDKLRKGNEETLRSVKFPNQASSIVLLSKGPTAGVLSDVIEDKPAPEPTEEDMEGSCENQEAGGVKEVSEEVTAETDEPQIKTPVTNKQAKVRLQVPVPVNIDLSSVHTDDTYDFNTDFK